MCYTLFGDRMEKKKSTTKSNKKGTNVNVKKTSTTAKKVSTNTSKKVETPKNISKVESEKIVKNTSVTENTDDFSGNEIRKLLIIIGAVCAIMLSFYFITEFVLKNKKNTKEPENAVETKIQYDEILMGSMLNQGSGEYYVFAYLEDDKMVNVYNSYIEQYEKIDGHKKFYRVNLSSDFNKSYLADEYYLEGNDISKIKVSGTTLIKIIDNSVSYSYRDAETIVDKILRLIG